MCIMTKDNKDNPSKPSNPTDSPKPSSSVSATEPPKLGDSVEYTPPPDLDGIDYSTIDYPDEELRAANIIIGYKLREVRLSARFTEQELAILLGTSMERIRQYESGERGITLAEVFKICEELGASAKYFV
jgi:DNA-binding XRE family transcriptional regulator